MSVFVISPHLDDAVLSLGQLIAHEAQQYDVRVVTVLAGVPDTIALTDYDHAHGFGSSRESVYARRTEDDKACHELGARPVHLDFLDGQYGARLPGEDKLITKGIERLIAPDSLVFAPLGLAHPDHELVGTCARHAAQRTGCGLIVYEELPARVLWPELVPLALDCVRGEGFAAEFWTPAAAPRDTKIAAMCCYSSQFAEPDDPSWLVPERCWRLSS